MHRGQTILVDTNVIIEAVRIGCWSAIKAYFRVETVEKCCEEARTGDMHRSNYVVVDEEALRKQVNTHSVSERELAKLAILDPNSTLFDSGERHLWAHALSRSDAWIASSADFAAVRAAVRLGWEERLVSLEELVKAASVNPRAGIPKEQFSRTRLSEWRTHAILERGSL
ncbi:MAG: hypothetical protein AB7T14_01320 [Candidatus Methylacidiphilaceae bacterium]